MSYNIYIKDHQTGERELVESGANYRTCEIYRECCRSGIEIEDAADTRLLQRNMPDDAELSERYGVPNWRVVEAAGIVTLCTALALLVMLAAWILD